MQKTLQNVINVGAVGLLALQLSACGRGNDSARLDRGSEWPQGYSVPIPGTTFPFPSRFLPAAVGDSEVAAKGGFQFFDGFAGRPFYPDTTVVSVAAGTVIRVDHEFSLLDAPAREFLSSRAMGSGAIADHALDRLRGRQVWIEHEGGYVSRYAHVSEVDSTLQPGDSVRQDQPIGMIGNPDILSAGGPEEALPRLHFELWSPDGSRYLGQEMSPLETHLAVARIFSAEALPRYARPVVSQVKAGQEIAEPYPPEELPSLEFRIDPPEAVAGGSAFAVPVTWENPEISIDDFFVTLDGRPLGLIDAGNGAWVLGSAPLEGVGEDLALVIGAVDMFGRTIGGLSTIEVTRPVVSNEAREVEPALLERYTEQNQRIEAMQLAPVHRQSLDLREAQWRTPFQPPLAGDIVATFGQLAVQGVRRPDHPLPGIEIQPNTESGDIGASNAGIVALVEELPIRGKTVALVHGGGVVTIYSQLGQPRVSVGDRVERGQTLATARTESGEVGAVRIEIHVAGIPSNPASWLDQILPVANAAFPN